MTASARGKVQADPTRVVVEGLVVHELVVAACPSQAPSDIDVDASCRLRAGQLEPDSLATNLQIRSLVPEQLLGPLFAAGIAGIVTGIFTTLMGGNGTFKQVFAVMAHAGFIPALRASRVNPMTALRND